MRALTSFAVALALTAGTFAGASASAAPSTSPSPQARDTPGCVTKHEYRKVHKRTRIRRVHRRFDTHGWFIDGGAGGFARGYKFCKRARHKAHAKRTVIIYHAGPKRTRIAKKYCGPTYRKRRPCFRKR